MNKIIYILITGFLLSGCAKEEAVPVLVDFDFEVFKVDYSIPVQVVFFNKTEGAENYEWHFEGGVPSTSTNRNPGVIKYDTKGVYMIELIASNRDGSRDSKVLEIQIDDPVVVNFTITNLLDEYSPATYAIENKTSGADRYLWTFENGLPSTSSDKDPGNVTFTEPGKHTITLEISNGRETYIMEKIITVAPFLVVDFGFEIAFSDDDYQIPAKVQFQNNSVSATSYQWSFQGASTRQSTDEDPEVIFTEHGTHMIVLTATNGKETRTISKTIEFYENTNLREIKDIKLGINTAHSSNVIGSFYSISDRKVYTEEDLTPEIEQRIDLVFFGLNQTFTRNRFVSPDNLTQTTFGALQNPKPTIFINSQELCGCAASLSPEQFDAMQDDTLLKNLVIEETPGGLHDFDNALVPRIVLFETLEGKKGALKIKAYQKEGHNSYVLVDLKFQKENK